MSDSTLGALASLATGLIWASSVVLFKRAGEHVGAYALNLYKNTISLPLFALSLWWVGGVPRYIVNDDFWILLVSGAVGVGIADALFFAALNRLGASRLAIVDCLYSPSVVVLAFFTLGERLSLVHGAGALLVVGGVLLGSTGGGRLAIERGRLIGGLAYAVAAVVLMGAAMVGIKPVLARHGVVWAVSVRMIGGVALQLLPLLFSKRLRSEVGRAFLPHASQRFSLPGAVLGTYVALLLWILGFKYTTASIAAVLNQTSTLFVVVLAAIFLHEPLTKRGLLAVSIAFSGSVVVLV